MNDRELQDRLREVPVPGAEAAEERAWRVIRAAYEGREPTALRQGRRARRARRLALVLAAALALLAIALSPAGAGVVDVVRDAIGIGEEDARPALRALPAPGELLVDSEAGPWVVREDGSKRLLGDYGEAAWSPRGLFVAAADGRQLVAVDPLGEVRWAVAAPRPVRDPRWSPSGLRIAYRSGDQLRVVDGDGSGDHRVARDVAPVPAAWTPAADAKLQPAGAPGTHQLAFADAAGRPRLIDADSGAAVGPALPAPDLLPGNRIDPVRALAWSPDGGRLATMTERVLRVDDLLRPGAEPFAYRPRGTGRLTSIAFAPYGDRLLALREAGGGNEIVVIERPGGGGPASPRVVFGGPGRVSDVTWSPDGRWILAGWRDADQWLFIRSDRPRRLVAIDDVSEQFGPGLEEARFPRAAGWVLRQR